MTRKKNLVSLTMEASAKAREDDQAASWTNVKAVETRTGVAREKDTMRDREPETENLAERCIDRGSGCDRDRQYTLMQRPSKQYNIELNKTDHENQGHERDM
jgi:hypothetical protein